MLFRSLNKLEEKNYGKDIMIVETGYCYAWPLVDDNKDGKEDGYDYTATYPYTEEGQRQYTADLVTKLKAHESVTGLFWWWIEDNGNKSVTSRWWNAALYNHDTGKPYAAFYELKNFNNSSSGFQDVKKEHKCKDCKWYTIEGRRLGGEPSKSGIYINNGKKKIVR